MLVSSNNHKYFHTPHKKVNTTVCLQGCKYSSARGQLPLPESGQGELHPNHARRGGEHGETEGTRQGRLGPGEDTVFTLTLQVCELS